MTSKEKNRRSKAAIIFTKSHNLWSYGMKHALSWKKLVGLCWMMEKGGVIEEVCYVKGVSFVNGDGSSRQVLLQRLTRVTNGSYWITLAREEDNRFDPNAIRVEVIKEGGSRATIGYISREIAANTALLLDSGKEAIVTGFEFTNPLCGLIGMKISFVCK